MMKRVTSLPFLMIITLIAGDASGVTKAINGYHLPQTTSNLLTGLSRSQVIDRVSIGRQPAEFEKQRAIWLIWPLRDHLKGYSNEEVTVRLINAILPYCKIRLSVANEELEARARKRLPPQALQNGRIEILRIKSADFWVRDMGPTFVLTADGRKAIVDYFFDGWGYAPAGDPDTQLEASYDRRVGEQLGMPVIATKMTTETGGHEVNGKGTMMLVEAVEQQRNPTMTKAEMEAEFRRLLGVKKFIWLKQGIREDDITSDGPIEIKGGEKAYTVLTTNGHLGAFARFVNSTTVLLAQVDPADMDDPIARENHRRMEENYQILKAATDQDGQPLKVVRLPMPRPVIETMRPGDFVYDVIKGLKFKDGSTFPNDKPIKVIATASYANFILANGVVVAQKYWRPGKDEAIRLRDQKAHDVLHKAFPNRKVIMIDALPVNFGGGGIRCISMHEPVAPAETP